MYLVDNYSIVLMGKCAQIQHINLQIYVGWELTLSPIYVSYTWLSFTETEIW